MLGAGERRKFYFVRTAPLIELDSVELYCEDDHWFRESQSVFHRNQHGTADRHLKSSGYGDTIAEAWELALKTADDNVNRAKASLRYVEDVRECLAEIIAENATRAAAEPPR